MNISHLAKIAALSIIALGLAASPALEAKPADTDKQVVENVKATVTLKPSDRVVNINNANKKQLSSVLNGVGEITAQAIIDYRNKHGAFKSIKDLIKVKGIGKKTLAKNNDKIMLSDMAVMAHQANKKNKTTDYEN